MSGFGGGGFNNGPPSSFGGSNSSGFHGNSNPQGYMAPFAGQQQPPAPPFGMPSHNTPLSSSNPAPPVFGAPVSFGAAAVPSSGLPFGTSSNATIASGGFGGPFPSGGNTGNTTMFGQSSTQQAFGQSTPTVAFSGGPFGQTTTSTTAPFGFNSTTTSAANTGGLGPFGTPASTATTPLPFGSSTTTAATANPFGVAQQAPAPALSFGVSANIAPPPPPPNLAMNTNQFAPAVPFGSNNNNNSAPARGPFGASSSNNSTHFGFASPTTAAPAFAAPASFLTSSQPQNYDDDGMADEETYDHHNNNMAQPLASSNPPFGRPSAAPTTAGGFGWARNSSHSTSPVPMGTAPVTAAAISNKSDVEEKLALMKAKLAEKMRKKEEKKKREEEKNSSHDASSALRADALVFVPGSTGASLAQRNADRFAQSKDTDTRSQLPADLIDDDNNPAAAINSNVLRNAGGRADREHLENAVSLVGVCAYMCPDEELLRRERESDIQLLERPVPDGNFHPRHWTLRDTMVKRFRRSAADYKLDVPEWVRPPDVLERVCGYLEEWVMVCYKLVPVVLFGILEQS